MEESIEGPIKRIIGGKNSNKQEILELEMIQLEKKPNSFDNEDDEEVLTAEDETHSRGEEEEVPIEDRQQE